VTVRVYRTRPRCLTRGVPLSFDSTRRGPWPDGPGTRTPCGSAPHASRHARRTTRTLIAACPWSGLGALLLDADRAACSWIETLLGPSGVASRSHSRRPRRAGKHRTIVDSLQVSARPGSAGRCDDSPRRRRSLRDQGWRTRAIVFRPVIRGLPDSVSPCTTSLATLSVTAARPAARNESEQRRSPSPPANGAP